MNNKPTRKELEKQIAELKRQNEILLSKISDQTTAENQAYTLPIINSIGDPLFIKDSQSRLLFVNHAFCKMFDLPKEEIIGKTLTESVTPEEREIFLKIDNQVLLEGIENINEETLTIKGREKLIISTRKSRYINESGTKFLVGVIRDITESKKAEEALKKSETEFRHLNVTKDRLFSIIGHDLRSPFSSILGLSDLLAESVNESDISASETYLEMINSTAINALNLLENLLKWAQSQTEQINYAPEKINLSQVAQEVLEQSNSISKTKNIVLKQTIAEEIELFSDEKMLKTILRNLISNAIKFTETAGTIRISAILKENQVEVTVADNGVGMNKEYCEKLFHTDKNISFKGTANEIGSGIGLVLCKEFVEKLGGTIWAESEECRGSTFIFTLPLKSAKGL